jgi:ABC-type transporter MlaC component
MGRRAIGDVLAAQPPAQQKEYLELFDTLIVRAYLQKLLLFRSPRFLYGQPRRAGDDVVVPTRIATPKDEYRVDYDMRNGDGRWMAIDVLVEDISLTDNYRSQFAALMRDRTFAELLAVMRAKVGTAPAEPAS